MTQYGKIIHYDSQTGSGMIAPLEGGDPLAFNGSGLQQQAQEEPRPDQLYRYETQMGSNGQAQAVNLQMDQGDSADHGGSFNQSGFNQQGGFDQELGSFDQQGSSGQRGSFDQQGQSENRANQEGVSRAGVDEPAREPGGGTSGGSTFQPLEADRSKSDRSDERQRDLGRDADGSDARGTHTQGGNDRRG